MGNAFVHKARPQVSAAGRVSAPPSLSAKTQRQVNDVLHAPGKPLDSETRASMEPRFRYDFSKVRVHADSNATTLAINKPGDAFEHEADRVAERVMRTSEPAGPVGIGNGRVLRRKCACGGTCSECEAERKGNLQRGAASTGESATVPPIVYDVLRSPGQPLDAATRAAMEPRFGRDFGKVRIHTDAKGAESARAVNALAYTVGHDVVFGAGQHAPHSDAGRRLMAHELTHVQQFAPSRPALGKPIRQLDASASERYERQADNVALGLEKKVSALTPSAPARPLLRAATPIGSKVTDPPGTKSPFKKVNATFDGATFTLFGDGAAIVTASAESGHPNQVDPAEAKACKGSATDSYLNNPRYVGIKDKGPIPEGQYTFSHGRMVTFSGMEQVKMSFASPGTYSDPYGGDVHGDWGAGRVPLAPVKGTMVAAKFCGSTSARSGFYLHGGNMTGSSGCIDVGNSAITDIVTKLTGFTKPVTVVVKYTQPPPQVGIYGKAAGRLMYPAKKNPSVLDRIKSVFGDDGN